MSVVCQDGFDFYNGTGANTGLQTRWGLGVAVGGAASLVAGRFGGQAVRCTPFINGRTVISRFLPVYPGNHTSVTCAAAFRFATATTNDFIWLCKDGGGSSQVVIRVGAGGQVQAYRGDDGLATHGGSVLLGSSAAGVIRNNTWHFVEVSSVSDAAAGTVVVKVDGATVLNLTGQNTRALAATGVNVAVMGANLVQTDVDDWHMLDAASGLGECRIESLRASADTATKDWLPNSGITNSTQVDDATANGDADYVQSTNVGDHDLYELTNLSTTPTTIHAVSPVVFARKTDSATRTLNVTTQSAGTDTDGPAFNLAADYNAFSWISPTDPHDGAAWDKSRVDALKVGPKVAS